MQWKNQSIDRLDGTCMTRPFGDVSNGQNRYHLVLKYCFDSEYMPTWHGPETRIRYRIAHQTCQMGINDEYGQDLCSPWRWHGDFHRCMQK